jgi:hypothetical protein
VEGSLCKWLCTCKTDSRLNGFVITSAQYIGAYCVGINAFVRRFRVEFVDLCAVTVRGRLAVECQQTNRGPQSYLPPIILN